MTHAELDATVRSLYAVGGLYEIVARNVEYDNRPHCTGETTGEDMPWVTKVPQEWRVARYLRTLPDMYTRDENIKRMLVRLARGTINDQKAEWLARAVHRTKPWAGRPVAFDDIGKFRPFGSKEADIASARAVLIGCKAALSPCVCAEPLSEGDVLEPCPVHGWVTH